MEKDYRYEMWEDEVKRRKLHESFVTICWKCKTNKRTTGESMSLYCKDCLKK